MKDKKGFTLVELLAVIAILAILVILALPNVIKIYTRARKSAFLTETKNIYKEAEKKFISGNITNTDIKVIDSENDSKLDMTGEKLKYCIVLDSRGKVELLKASNGKYVIEVSKDEDIANVDIDRITEGNLDDYKCNGVVPPKATSCTYDGELVQGAEFVQGKFTYRYMQEGKFVRDGKSIDWTNITIDGWGVQLTDKTSTEPVVAETCTYINNKPVVSAAEMFSMSQASSIDMSKMNSSNIVSFAATFSSAEAKSINLKNIDTSNATTFAGMFEGTKTDSLDVSGFDTRKVNNMNFMFNSITASEIKGIEKLDTRNVMLMIQMFANTNIKSIDLSNFNTKNVTSMAAMFLNSSFESLDLKSFDTSNVTDMSWMFWRSKAENLDLSSFNTSNVRNFADMFYESKAKKLDLRNFDTSSATSFAFMFYNSAAETIDVSSFNTSKVTSFYGMFWSTKIKSVDLSHFDTSSELIWQECLETL